MNSIAMNSRLVQLNDKYLRKIETKLIINSTNISIIFVTGSNSAFVTALRTLLVAFSKVIASELSYCL
jgi:hexokinase